MEVNVIRSDKISDRRVPPLTSARPCLLISNQISQIQSSVRPHLGPVSTSSALARCHNQLLSLYLHHSISLSICSFWRNIWNFISEVFPPLNMGTFLQKHGSGLRPSEVSNVCTLQYNTLQYSSLQSSSTSKTHHHH